MNISLEKIDLENISELKVSYEEGYSRITNYLNILVIKYAGVYGVGSGGNSDATFMFAKAAFAIAAIEPFAIIIDLTDLKYVWGDQLEMIFNIQKPMALIVGEHCQEAIGTLIHGIESIEPPTTISWIFDNLEDAWNYLENEIEKQAQ
ncbi:MAG: hypothetical protein IPJ81_16890 [Chitinophagaceae bacterium]|nr:hypothetical protein [Chitinophagaceae bacterium]